MSTEPEQLSDAEADKLFEKEFARLTNQEYNESEAPAAEEQPEEEVKVVEEQPVVEPPVAEETKTNTPPSDPNEWLKTLPEEARNRYLKDQQDFKANASRVAGFQRQLDEARRQLHELKNPPAKQPEPEPKKLDKWEALTETDKELALSVEQRIADAVAQATKDVEARFIARVAPIEHREYEAQVQNELYLLKQAVPNYEEVVQDPHFQTWIYDQSPMVRQKYEQSIDHRDALDVMKLYSLSLGYTPASQSTPAPQPNPEADKVAAAREQRRQTSTPVKSNSTGIPRNPHNEELSDAEADKLYEAAFKKALTRVDY